MECVLMSAKYWMTTEFGLINSEAAQCLWIKSEMEKIWKLVIFFFLNRSRITFNKTLNDMKYTFEVNWDMKFSQLCKYCCSSISLQLTFNSYHHNGARNVKSNVFLKNVNHRHQAAGSRLFAYLPITIRLCETR